MQKVGNAVQKQVSEALDKMVGMLADFLHTYALVNHDVNFSGNFAVAHSHPYAIALTRGMAREVDAACAIAQASDPRDCQRREAYDGS